MTILRNAAASVVGLALVLSFASVVSAQTNTYFNYDYCNNYAYSNAYPYNTYPYNYSYGYPQYYNGTCPHGSVFVYVQIPQPNLYNTANRKPSDFTVSVAGQNVSNPSFPGSSSGTEVKLVGSYSVSVSPFTGYYPTYSPGCTGSVSIGTQATCVITINPANYPYPQYPYPQYPYPQYPQYQQPVFQAAPSVVLTAAPSLPNTGFEPFSLMSYGGATGAFVLAAIIAVALISLAYVRKTIAYIRA